MEGYGTGLASSCVVGERDVFVKTVSPTRGQHRLRSAGCMLSGTRGKGRTRRGVGRGVGHRVRRGRRRGAFLGRGSLLTCGDVEEHPGPSTMSLGTANVTSLRAHPAVGEWDVDVCALQEVRLTEEEMKGAANDVKGYGAKQLLFGAPCRRSQGSDPLRTRTQNGGVAIMTCADIPTRAVPPQCAQQAWNECRFTHAQVAYGSGGRNISVFSFYGVCADSDRTEQLLTGIFEEAASLGDIPVFIAGDFNVEANESLAIRAAISSGKWVDAADTYAQQLGKAAENTCYTSTSSGRRIDLVLANHVAAPAISKVVVWKESCLPVHRPVVLTLDLTRYEQKAPQARPPLSLIGDDWTKWPAKKEKELAAKVMQENAAPEADLTKMSVEDRWARFCKIAEDYLLKRGAADSDPKQQRHRGRGEVQPDVLRHRTARMDCDTPDAVNLETAQLQKTCRQMEQLIGDRRKRFGQPSAESLNERQLWAKIRKKKHLLKSDTWDLDLPGIEALCGPWLLEEEGFCPAGATASGPHQGMAPHNEGTHEGEPSEGVLVPAEGYVVTHHVPETGGRHGYS